MKIQEIQSAGNPAFKRLRALTRPRGIKRHGLALISGPKQIREILDDFPAACAGLICEAPGPGPWGEGRGHLPVLGLSKALFRELDLFGTGPPLLLVRVPGLAAWSDGSWPKGCTLFVPFQDPGNVGLAIRSAAAFGVCRVVMLREAAHPFHPRAARAAGSQLFRVPLFKGPSLGRLNIWGAPLITLSPKGSPLGEMRFPRTFGLLPGLEGPGLPQTVAARVSLAVPMAPGVESLNAAIATGIALYAWRNSRPAIYP